MSERAQLYKALADGRPGGARPLRKMLDSEAPLTEAEPEKAPQPNGVDVFAAIKSNRTLQGVGELLRPRQEAVDLLPDALREGSSACPPYVPSLSPQIGEVPRAPQDPAL